MSMFASTLIADQLTKCCFMDKTTAPDGYGGYVWKWQAGAEFDAIITENSSIEASIAQAISEVTTYGIKVSKNVPLMHHTVFKRLSDNKVFRITRAEAMLSPSFSPLDMKTLDAEEFELLTNPEPDEQEASNG